MDLEILIQDNDLLDDFNRGVNCGYAKGFTCGLREAEMEIDLILSGKDSIKTGYPWTILRRIVQEIERESKT